jgi:hypothetical protein
MLLEAVFRSSRVQRKTLGADSREKGVILLLSNARKNKNCNSGDLNILK